MKIIWVKLPHATLPSREERESKVSLWQYHIEFCGAHYAKVFSGLWHHRIREETLTDVVPFTGGSWDDSTGQDVCCTCLETWVWSLGPTWRWKERQDCTKLSSNLHVDHCTCPHIICMHKITIIHRFAFSFIFMWSFSFSAMGQSMCTVREEGAQTSQTTFRTSGPRENTGLQISFSGPISELVKQIQRKIYPTNFCYHPRLPWPEEEQLWVPQNKDGTNTPTSNKKEWS